MRRSYQRRRELTAEETAANAARKAARLKATMHCQICNRRILANTGLIAHHGYQRPYEQHWQTSSCYGARERPFEVSRDRLGQYIDMMVELRAREMEARTAIDQETAPAVFVYTKRGVDAWAKKETVRVPVTRATFAAAKAEHAIPMRQHSMHSFDDVKKHHLAGYDYRIKQIDSDLDECRKRWAGWKPTHAGWLNGEWSKL